MDPVNRRKSPGSPAKTPGTPPQVRQSGPVKKTWVIKVPVTKNQDITEAAKSVPGIEVLAEAPAGCRRFAGPYYPDEVDLLLSTLRGLRNRGSVIVAKAADGWTYIFRKGAKAR